MAGDRSHPLLAPGNEEEWARINAEEARQEAEFAAGLSPSERLALGQSISDQAFELINGVRAGGHVTARDPRA